MVTPCPPLPRTRPKHTTKATNTPENSRLSKPPRASRGRKPWPRMGRWCPHPRLQPVEPLKSHRAEVSPELFSPLPTPNLASEKGLSDSCLLLFLLVWEYSIHTGKGTHHMCRAPQIFQSGSAEMKKCVTSTPVAPPWVPSRSLPCC